MAVVSANKSNGWRKVVTTSPSSQVQFDSTKLSKRRFWRGSCRALGFMLGDLGEGGKAAEPNALDPSSGLGDCGEQSIAPFGTHRRFCGGRMKDAPQSPEP